MKSRSFPTINGKLLLFLSGVGKLCCGRQFGAIEPVEIRVRKLFQPCGGRAEGMRCLLSAVQFGVGGVDDQIPIGCIEITNSY